MASGPPRWTGGTFQLWPHNYQVRPSNPGVLSEQLKTSTRLLGAVHRPIGAGVVSWTITTIGAVIAAIIYGLLKGELNGSPLLDMVHRLFK